MIRATSCRCHYAQPPASLSLVSHADSDVQLAWTPGQNANTYNVHRAPNGGTYGLLASHAVLSHTDETATPTATQYAYVVTSENGRGESAATAAVFTPPLAPTWDGTPLTDEGGFICGVHFDHVAESGGGWVQQYQVEAKNNANPYEVVGTLAAGVTTCQFDAGALPGSSEDSVVSVRIRAGKGGLWGPYSTVATILLAA